MRLRLPRRHSNSVSITAPAIALVRAVACTSFQAFVVTPGVAPSAVKGDRVGSNVGAGVVVLAALEVSFRPPLLLVAVVFDMMEWMDAGADENGDEADSLPRLWQFQLSSFANF